MVCKTKTFSVPFLFAYIKNLYTWWTEAFNKKQTFMLPLLNLYPQFGKPKSKSFYLYYSLFGIYQFYTFRGCQIDFRIMEKPD